MALMNKGGGEPAFTGETLEGPGVAIDPPVENDSKKRGRTKTPKPPKAAKVIHPSRVRWGRVMIGCTLAIAAGGGAYALSASLAPTAVQVASLIAPVTANNPLDSASFGCIEVSASVFPAGTYTCEYIAGLEEPLYASKDLVAGDWVSDDTFNSVTRIDVTTLTDPSLLAQTFTADAESAVGGRLRPGDLVNILATSTSSGDTAVTSFLLTKVLLLDVSGAPVTRGQAATSTTIGGDAAGSDTTAVARLYTVALDPEQTKTLTAAKGQSLTVVLTRPDAPDIKGSNAAAAQIPAPVEAPVDAAAEVPVAEVEVVAPAEPVTP